MTADKALHQFFNGFGIPAYPETAVPEDKKMPYITYPFAVSWFDGFPVNLAVYIWYKTESEALPTEKALEIMDAIGREGCTINVDGGYIWLTITTRKATPLSFHDVFRRESDGTIFRATSNGNDKQSPNVGTLDMCQVTAERWELPNDG